MGGSFDSYLSRGPQRRAEGSSGAVPSPTVDKPEVLMLRLLGNGAVTRLLQERPAPATPLGEGPEAGHLRISHPADPAEQEASALSRGLARALEAPDETGHTARVPSVTPSVPLSRSPGGCGSRPCDDAAGTDHDAPIEVRRALATQGVGLDPVLRRSMGRTLGIEFPQALVHDDPTAHRAAAAVQARAFTVGRHIVFGADQYAPETLEGRELLAHELVHVVQRPRDVAASGRILAREPLAPHLQQSMTQSSVSALSNEEIDARIEAISQAMSGLGVGTPELLALQENLKLLEDEIVSRGYESPVLTRMALVGAVGELLEKAGLIERALSALWGSSWGNSGAIELFKRRYGTPAEKQLEWIKAATNSAGQLAISAPKHDPDTAFAAFADAGTKLIAATFGLQLLGVWLAWLQLVDVVLHRGLFYSVERMFVKTDEESKFVAGPFSELATLIADRVQAAAIALPSQLDNLVKDHSALVAEIELAIKNGQQFMRAGRHRRADHGHRVVADPGRCGVHWAAAGVGRPDPGRHRGWRDGRCEARYLSPVGGDDQALDRGGRVRVASRRGGGSCGRNDDGGGRGRSRRGPDRDAGDSGRDGRVGARQESARPPWDRPLRVVCQPAQGQARRARAAP